MIFVPTAADLFEGRLDNRDRLQRIRAFGRHSSLKVPEFPRRSHHQRLGGQRADVVVIGELCMHLSHGLGVGVIPPRQNLFIGLCR